MRKAFVPENWITSKLSDTAFRTLCVIAMHRNKENNVYITNDKLASILNKDVRRIQSDINQALQIGIIERNFDRNGKRYLTIVDNHTDDEKRQGVTENTMTKNVTPCQKTSSGGDEKRHRGMTENVTPPNNPSIGSNILLQFTNTEKDPCVSASGVASLPLPTAKAEIPPDLKSMASTLGLESWIGELQFQSIPLDDWRIRYTLGVMHSKGGKSGSRYAWGVFRNLPEQQPKPAEIAVNGSVTTEAQRAKNRSILEDAFK